MSRIRPSRVQIETFVVAFEAEDAIIVGLGRVVSEDGRDLAIDLEGVGHLGNAAHGGLRGQAEVSAKLRIAELVKVELPKYIGSEALGGERRTALVAALEGRAQDRRLFAGRLELDGGDQLHFSNIENFAPERKEESALRRPLSPPPP